jgi:hypothetical protein
MGKVSAETVLKRRAGAQRRGRWQEGAPAVLAEWLDLRALTHYACVSERTIRSWLHLPVNPLPSSQVGTKILVSRRNFDVWLEGHRLAEDAKIDALMDEIVGGIRTA